MKLDDLRKSKNIANDLDDTELSKISEMVIGGYEHDDQSRSYWKQINKDALDLAKQTIEEKSTPFQGAANVKFPLITKASIDFAARTYPELVRNNSVVKANIVGYDPQNKKAAKAQNVSTYMSYLLLKQMDGWEEDLDKLLHVVAIVGTVFKKTYWDPIKKLPVSELCNPNKIVVNHNVKSLKEARRITHVMEVYKNDIIQQVRLGNYRDIDLDSLVIEGHDPQDSDPQYTLLEQHTYLDLDDDGYKEPYVVIVHLESREVLTIRPRFKDVMKSPEGGVIHIEPDLVFTDFHFIRSQDGGFYSLGFGCLLLPINHSINTTINQLLDAGTLNNLQSGLIGKGIRIKNNSVKPKMGEYIVVDVPTGMDLRSSVVPLPTKEPSMVLFQLLQLLIQAGKELTSSSEVTSGQAPPSNVPGAAYLNSVEQSLKILNAINKRLYKSESHELELIFYLLSKNLSDKEYQRILDNPNARVKDDFDSESYDICPIADPSMTTAEQRMARIQAIMGIPIKNQDAATILYLQTLEVDPNMIKILMTAPENQPPSAEIMKIMAEIELIKAQAAETAQRPQIEAGKLLVQHRNAEINEKNIDNMGNESAARIIEIQHKIRNDGAKTDIAAQKAEHAALIKELALIQKKISELEDRKIKDKEIDLKTAVEMAKVHEKSDTSHKQIVADLVKADHESKSKE